MIASTKRHCESRLTAGSSPTNFGGVAVESYSFDSSDNVLGVYDGSGNPLATSALGNRYLFQGREYSWATHEAWDGAGLYYFRARYYDPSTGRWLSNDPIGISGGLNQYAFCANNPVGLTDPTGLVDAMPSGPMDAAVEAGIATAIYVHMRGTLPGHNDINDARRHAETSKFVAEATSLWTSWMLGLLNEIKNRCVDKQDPSENVMDVYNNVVGLVAAQTGENIKDEQLMVLGPTLPDYPPPFRPAPTSGEKRCE